MAEKVDAERACLVIEPRHREFLVVQKGRIYDIRADIPLWTQQYQADLLAAYESMVPVLPDACSALMDIGSGLGGIDVLLSRHYDGKPFINLVDGAADQPVVKTHAQTFNNMEVALDFHARNGVRNVGFCAPGALFTPRPMELIISQASWCFHYPPEIYLPWVLQCCHPGTVLIMEVRRDYVTWQRVLDEVLEPIADLFMDRKFIRRAYRPRV